MRHPLSRSQSPPSPTLYTSPLPAHRRNSPAMRGAAGGCVLGRVGPEVEDQQPDAIADMLPGPLQNCVVLRWREKMDDIGQQHDIRALGQWIIEQVAAR
jgi:hypothetical protein